MARTRGRARRPRWRRRARLAPPARLSFFDPRATTGWQLFPILIATILLILAPLACCGYRLCGGLCPDPDLVPARDCVVAVWYATSSAIIGVLSIWNYFQPSRFNWLCLPLRHYRYTRQHVSRMRLDLWRRFCESGILPESDEGFDSLPPLIPRDSGRRTGGANAGGHGRNRDPALASPPTTDGVTTPPTSASAQTSAAPDDLSVIDLTGPPGPAVFIPEDWYGKEWIEGQMPDVVEVAKSDARVIPTSIINACIPGNNIPVGRLLSDQNPLHHATAAPRYFEQRPSFSDTEPISDDPSDPDLIIAVTSLLKNPLPPPLALRTLRQNFPQAFLNGARSIQFPTSGKPLRLPLWSEHLLSEIEQVVQKRRRWTKATEWLTPLKDQAGAVGGLATEVLTALATLPYNQSLRGFSHAIAMTTMHAANLLGTTWLSDDHMNAGFEYISHQLGDDSADMLLDTHHIERLRAQQSQAPEFGATNRLLDIEAEVLRRKPDRLWLPLHVDNTHWTLLIIDMSTSKLIYGDGSRIGSRPPQDTVDLIAWWMARMQLWDENTGPTCQPLMSMPVQPRNDGHNCGPITLSTAASILLSYPPWFPQTASAHRMSWFLRFINARAGWANDPTHDSRHRESEVNTSEAFARAFGTDITNIVADSSSDGLTSAPASEVLEAARDAFTELSLHDAPPRPGSQSNVRSNRVTVEEEEEDDGPPDLRSMSDGDSCMDISDDGFPESDIEIIPADDNALPDLIPYLRSAKNKAPRSEHDHVDDPDRTPPRYSKRARHSGDQGTWHYQRSRRDLADAGELSDDGAWQNFRTKIRVLDRHAEFDPTNLRRVRCSRCSNWVLMRIPFEIRRFSEHRLAQTCVKRGHSQAGSTQSLLSYGFTRAASAPADTRRESALQTADCPGLTAAVDARIDKYLHRTAVSGGGAPSLRLLTQQLYPGCVWKDLTEAEQRIVLRREAQQFLWVNRHDFGAVYSSSCRKTVLLPYDIERDQVPPCDDCVKLLSNRLFQTRLNHEPPTEANMRYVPKRFRSNALGHLYAKFTGLQKLVETRDGESPWQRFVSGVLNGTFSNYPVFLGMLDAMTMKTDRDRLGKKMNNMQYPSAFNEVCNAIALVSPRAYKIFRHHFGGRSLRSMRGLRSVMPRFRPGISADNITQLAQELKRLDYHGPVGLSWDDTELAQALKAYQDSKDRWLILGSIGDPIRVEQSDTDDAIDALLADKSLNLASKVRLWVITIPIPGVPPVVIAALARGKKDSAETLQQYHSQLVGLLDAEGIHPLSLACDGTEVERSLQRLLTAEAEAARTYIIKSNDGSDLTIRVPLFFGHPSVMVQDSKHAAKTARNQILSGARFITLGQFPLHFQQLQLIAEHPLSPLFRRDVHRVDRQDDRAAARLLSGDLLDFLVSDQPQNFGLIVYLFVMGETVDAWQNRWLEHGDRALIVLRTRFFIIAWREFILRHPHYRLSHQFISREFFDIITTLCDSLLALILIHRDFYSGYPFLPWLHSTECCEHIFGILRQLKPDFDFSDFLFLMPKLKVLLLGKFTEISPQAQANQTASGYHHTYFDTSDLKLAALRRWPSDLELGDILDKAYKEAETLLAAVGLKAKDLLSRNTTSAASRMQASDAPPSALDESVPFEDEPLIRESVPVATAWHEITDYLKLFEEAPLCGPTADGEMTTGVYAVAAANVDSSLAISALPDSEDGALDEVRNIISRHLEKAQEEEMVSAQLPKTIAMLLARLDMEVVPDDGQLPQLYALPSDNLRKLMVANRRLHQPASTTAALRRGGRMFSSDSTTLPQPEEPTDEPLGLRLARHLRTVVPAHLRGVTSGVGRQVRHTGQALADVEGTGVREENKGIVRGHHAQSWLKLREGPFHGLQAIHNAFPTANISSLATSVYLRPGCSLLVLEAGRVTLVEVITMYYKSVGAGARYDLVTEASSLGAVSAVGARMYLPFNGGTFSSATCPELSSPSFLYISSADILFSFGGFKVTKTEAPTPGPTPLYFLSLSDDAYVIYLSSVARTAEIVSAVKLFDKALEAEKKRKK